MDKLVAALAAELITRATRSGLWLAAAESCTGGLIASALTSVPGSSAAFGTGFVTYSNAAKMQQLGVNQAVLAREGAVSQAVALAMAEGARARSGADLA
ncbi:MAG: nicotinamide-nucleotide amidohydrolase family protein, partial [Pseudomonadota bacterium]